ncbi:hypothetical protein CIPAW_15G141900 [Carya illinoinensis]|uniref:Uncharacterized protein n=1 Tax=Carya illinoinensis TaxID=32201 RepID=A0A8T1NBA6_CARIL|nr:hypothetical protein CIPAW_15G141900 [Carya illinoinensis]
MVMNVFGCMTYYKLWVKKLFKKNHPKILANVADCGFTRMFVKCWKKIRGQTKLKVW